MYRCVRVTSRIILSGALLAGMTGLWAKSALAKSPDAPPIPSYAKMALTFEINRGQTDSEVRFLSRGSGYTLFLTPGEAVLALSKPARDAQRPRARRTPRPGGGAIERTVLRMRFIGANPNPVINGVQKLRGKSNYLIGKDRTKWRTNVSHYAKVRYTDVYPGIDLVFYGSGQRHLEYDFIVAPGADASAIELGFEGAKRLEIDAKGDLVLHIDGGKVRQHKPVLYQEVAGVRREIGGAYVFKDRNRVGFKVAAYDTSRPLVIDPVLSYASYLGGSEYDAGNDVAVDSSGSAYVTGNTASSDFPIVGEAEQVFFGGNMNYGDAFVTKVNENGTGLIYSTYLGGPGADSGAGIAVDADGNAYVTGWTDSGADFPTTPDAFQTNFAGPRDVFVTKLNPDGNLSDFCLDETGVKIVCSSFPYSTFLNGSRGYSFGFAIDVDTQGSAYVVGNTSATDFPTTDTAFQLQPGDAFLTRLNATGSGLLYSTYLSVNDLSVNGETEVKEIAVDATGNAHVVGTVWFPERNEDNTQKRDGFVAKYDTEASGAASRVYISSFAELGPSITGSRRITFGYGVAVDATSNVYLTGSTSSPDSFPTIKNAFQKAFGGGKKCSRLGIACPPDAFVMKLDSSGALVCSTYLGGSEWDTGWDIAVDGTGDIYVTGRTESQNFPLQSPFQNSLGGGGGDAFVAKLNGDCSALVYSSYLGGVGNEHARGIAVDDAGSVYVAGAVVAQPDDPSDLSTPGAFQPFFGGGSSFYIIDAFVAKISEQPGSGDPPVGCSDFTLTANGYKVKGKQKADLEWCGAGSTNVDILRDGAGISTTANDGFYTDNIDQKGGGTYIYQICETGTANCSNEATVTF